MGRLSGQKIYLSGSMDECSDRGISWRKEITPRFYEFGMGVFDPCDKPCFHKEDADFAQRIFLLKHEGKYKEAKEELKIIAGDDLRMVHESSALCLYIDKTIFMFGTPVEAAWAIQQRKPVLTVVKQGKVHVPNFLLALIPHETIFSSFNDMFDYLGRVDKGEEPDLRRWHFFDYDKVYGRKQ